MEKPERYLTFRKTLHSRNTEVHLWQSLFNADNEVFFEAPVTRVRVPPLKKPDIMDVGCPWTPSSYSTEDAWSRFALGESNAVQRWGPCYFNQKASSMEIRSGTEMEEVQWKF